MVCVPILLFVAASALVCVLPVLPATGFLGLGVPIAVVALACTRIRWLGALYLGFACAALQGAEVLSRRLPVALEGKDVQLTGRIVSLPQIRDGVVRFRFKVTRCEACGGIGTVVLSAYPGRDGGTGIDPAGFGPGQQWRLTTRMNRPRGSANSGLFDYEGWLLSEGIIATGYIRQDPAPVLLSSSGLNQLHHQVRGWLQGKIESGLAGSRVLSLVVALAIGESSAIDTRDWRVLSDTGTNHLLIISGLHVGLVAAASYKLLLLFLRHLVTGAQRWASVLSLLVAFAYGALAGLGLPVQRALVMTAVALSGVILNRNVPVRYLFCYALLAVTLFDPFAALRPGFWLSFGAVFVLVYAFAGRFDSNSPSGLLHWSKAALKSQWVVFAGMFPVLLALVHQVSLVAFLANLVAILWVSLTVIPLLLAVVPALALLPPLGNGLLAAADFSLSVLWHFLAWAASLDFVYFNSNPLGAPVLLLALAGVAILLLPAGLVARWPGLLLLLPLLTTSHQPLARGEMRINVVDVGQGLAVIIKTASHTLLYDAGPRFGQRFDAGEQIVAPLLRLGGSPRYLDSFVLSHSDLDHAGGANAIQRNFLVATMFTNEATGVVDHRCDDDFTFMRDGVRFTLFSLRGDRDNDRSCVLLVTADNFSLLLPGDIEAAGEAHLLSKLLPPIDVLVAPHHGSKSSSSPAFVNHTRAAHVIFATGYRNRFGHPDPTVTRRYELRGIRTWNTAEDGGIRIHVSARGHYEIRATRRQEQRFWYD